MASSCLRSVLVGALSLTVLVMSAACGDEEDGAGPGGGLASSGCGGSASGGLQQAQTLSVRGETRTYELFVPDGAASALPLVFVFHGSGGTGKDQRASSYNLEAEAKGKAIFVYPDGMNRQWDLDRKADDNADIQFFDALVESISSKLCVDRARIFATGYSMGAYFTNQLGCRRGNVLRAIAAHAGGGPFGSDDEYDENGDLVCPQKAVPALISHGTSDMTVPLSEGKSSRDGWQKANTCASTTRPYAPSPCVALDGCARPVVYCEIPGLGHEVWPAGGAAATWRFFSSF